MKINLNFTKNNKLKITIFNNQYKHGDFKICVSLIYSIQGIDGGIISKKIGRYYEIYSEKDEVIFTLQEPRIGSYNLSCGPEGLFVLGKNNQIIECKIDSLKFESPIPQILYSDDQDKIFDPVTVRFKGISFGRIVLPPKTLRLGQLVVSGKTYFNSNDSMITNVEVSMQNFDNVIYKTRSNESGFYQLAIPGEYRYAEHLRIVAGDNLIFKAFKKKLDFSGSRKIKLDIGIGPSKDMVEPIYLTNKDNVHFRDGPEIGAKTLFLLKEGEAISVDRVTLSEYFGSIEVEIDNSKKVEMDGWINRGDLRLVNMRNVYKTPDGN